MAKEKWQHCVMRIQRNLDPGDNDLPTTEPDTGYEVSRTKWGQWHAVSYTRHDDYFFDVLYRRLLIEKGWY